MADREQTYKNHARFLPPFHFFVIPVLLANVVYAGRHLVTRGVSITTGWEFVVAVALMLGMLLSRVQALSAQDRVIRLEMRLRLKQVLPADLQPKINDLSTKSLVALRFASDAELPDLVREVLAGKLDKQKDIKLRIKNWQADWQRV
ncbi:MAG: hypothetical protein HY048_11990 [Acidobacteria bacterium]|nr:hypothetical protein [Acidobacteriota bacterium]